ncbi:hypothetical protein CICLE_v10002332mg [Citrus x clementina]|uniref:Thioredoxin-like fold domain-containing protein n=1 Tax=Citrus clementina TaxID=85681 RepID=V4TFK5_CITCL|nr:uncharacterized protein LOC18040197 [Citrus x clementina]ESR48486.1 hypothetical protein CICLE_v10002332mg [Citrus x clementina]
MQSPSPNKNHATLILQSALLCFFVFNSCSKSQSTPPAKYDGFFYANHPVDSDAIIIEAFFDPVCPDSRDAWPPLKQALQHYGPHVSLVVHLLPLPYHDNAYATSRALHIVNRTNSSATFCLLEWFYKQQEKFYNAPTQNMTRTAVVKEIVKFAAEGIGNSYSSALESGFSDRSTDLLTRVSFKFSATRGVYATPTFFVNGFSLAGAGSPLDYNGWRKVIDPLLSEKGKKREVPLHLFL